MKTNLPFKIATTLIFIVFCMNIFAVEVIFDPSLLTPSDTGYYVKGYDKWENEQWVHYDSCSEEMVGQHFFEADTLNGFYFQNAIVMPDCPSKNHDPSNVSLGYIMLDKSWYLGTDSADLGTLVFPPIQGLQKITIEVSPDVTPDAGKKDIWFFIEYSKDDGVTWINDVYVKSDANDKAGLIRVFESGSDLNFDFMMTESQDAPITLRIRSKHNTDTGTPSQDQPQRLRVHFLKLEVDMLGLNKVKKDIKIEIRDHMIFSYDGEITVLNTLGQIVGKGESVQLNQGLYIVKNNSGATRKVYIE